MKTAESLIQSQESQPAMTQQLALLREAVHSVLELAQEPLLEAIPWVHLKHPISAKQRELLGKGVLQSKPNSLKWLLQLSRAWLYSLYLVFRLGQVRWHSRSAWRQLRQQRSLALIKSWQVDAKKPSDSRDFYWGDLQSQLRRRGLSTLLLQGPSTGRFWEKQWIRQTTSDQLPEMSLVPLWVPWAALWRTSLASIRLLRSAGSVSERLSQSVLNAMAIEALNFKYLPTMLYAWIGQEVIRRFHPEALLTLYEGHGWETLMWLGAKQADPDCRTVGYQHTVVLPHQLDWLKPPKPGHPVRPDAVLCLGSLTQSLLESGHPASQLIPFGSFRYEKTTIDGQARFEQKTVLVVPEGHLDEATLLFDAALEAAEALPEHRFIFRSHPVLPFEKVRPSLRRDPDSLENVVLSENQKIEEDFAVSSDILYRGSSAVLYAVLRSLRPLYWDVSQQEVIDPLFELRSWRVRVDSVQALVSALKAPAVEPDALREAQQYVAQYTRPVTVESLNALEELIRSNPRGLAA